MRKASLVNCDGDGDAEHVGEQDYKALCALELTKTTIDLPNLKKLLETPLCEEVEVSQNFKN